MECKRKHHHQREQPEWGIELDALELEHVVTLPHSQAGNNESGSTLVDISLPGGSDGLAAEDRTGYWEVRG